MDREKIWTLRIVCAATAMLMLDISVVNTALPAIAADLRAGLGDLQWVVDAYTVPLAATVLVAGSIADRIGRKRMLLGGLALFTLASLACGLAGSIAELNAGRAAQGIGGAALFASTVAVLADAFPGTAERARAFAIYGATMGASFAVAPLIGGVLTETAGWGWIFLINVPLGVATIALAARHVPESRDSRRRRIDVTSAVTMSAGLFALVLALLRGNEEGWASAPVVLCLAGAVALLGAFVIRQVRAETPLLPLGHLRRPAFAAAQLGGFALAGSLMASFIFLTIYLQSVLGLSAVQAGLAYLPSTAAMCVAAALTPRVSARFGPRVALSGGLLLAAAGLALLLAAGVASSWTVVVPGTVLALAGAGLVNPTVGALGMSALPARDAGLAAGTGATFRQTGIAVGVAALGALFPAGGLGAGAAAAFVDGLHTALTVSAALAGAGAAACWLLLTQRAPRAIRQTRSAIMPLRFLPNPRD